MQRVNAEGELKVIVNNQVKHMMTDGTGAVAIQFSGFEIVIYPLVIDGKPSGISTYINDTSGG